MSQVAYSLLFAPNILVALTVLAVLLLLLRRRILAIICLVSGLAWVLIWSLPVTTLLAGGWLEERYPKLATTQYPEAQAIVVLGGHIQGNRRNWFEPYDREAVVSRDSLAADLFFANKAPIILLSGGALVGKISDTASMARSLVGLGVPNGAIFQETQSQSTRENAQRTEQTLNSLGVQRALLVTSALHMPRAMAAFSQTAIAVTAAPLPPQIWLDQSKQPEKWLPDLQTLLASRSIIKEYAGLLMHWLESITASTTKKLN